MNAAKQLLFIHLLVLAEFLSAQPLTLQFHRTDDMDGLNKEFIAAILPEKNGGLWAATQNGLAFYDGNHTTHFRHSADSTSIPSNIIKVLTADKDGNLWGGTPNGIFRFDRKKQKFHNYNLPDELEMGAWNIVCDNDSTVWIGSWIGLTRLNLRNGKFDTSIMYHQTPNGTVPLNMYYNCMLDDPSGKGLWLATSKGLCFFNKQTRRMEDANSFPDNPLFNFFRSIALGKTNDERFWYFDIDRQTLVCFNPKSRSIITEILIGKPGKEFTVRSIFESGDGKLWLGLMQNMIMVVDAKTGEVLASPRTNLADPYSIPSNTLLSCIEDADGTVWLGTSAGLCKWNQQLAGFQIHSFLKEQLAESDNDHILGIVEDSITGNWWIASKKDKIIQYDPVHVKTSIYDLNKIKPGRFASSAGYVKNIRCIKGQIIVGTSLGCYVFRSPGKFEPFQPLPPDIKNFVATDVQSPDGENFYYTDEKTVILYNPTTSLVKYLNKNNSKDINFETYITNITKSKDGSVWATAGRNWLLHYKGDQVEAESIKQNSGSESRDHLVSLDVDNDGNIWTSSLGSGLYKYDPKTKSSAFYTSADDLATTNAPVIKADRYNNIWCSDRNNFSVLMSNSGLFYNFTLPANSENAIWASCLVRLKNGNIVAGNYRDLVEFFPDRLMLKPHIQVPVISGAEINRAFRLLLYDSLVRLKPDENSLILRFGLMTDKEIFPYSFSWMLEGFEKDWQPATDRVEAVYNQLPPGKYTFRLKGIAKNKSWETPEKTMLIIIQQRFYQTWWFKLLVLLVAGSLLYGFIRFRIQKHKQILNLESKSINLEREVATVQYDSLKQQLNPHFLFNSMASLRSLIRTDGKMASRYLDGLSRVYRYVLKSGDNKLVTVKDEIEFAKSFSELQRIRFADGLQVSFNIDPSAEEKYVTPVVLQNMIENALKHNTTTADSPLHISIYTEVDYLVVRNNLQRYKVVETSNKLGLQSLQKLYSYYTDKPLLIEDDGSFYTIKIPML